MKKRIKIKFLLLCLFGYFGGAFGQENEIRNEGNYFFNYVSLQDLQGLTHNSPLTKTTITKAKEEISGTKYRVTVKKVVNDKVHFTFWKFNTKINELINNVDSTEDSRIEYIMSLEEFKNNTKPLYNKVDWRVGIFTTPLKLRLKDFSFDANVNLGTSIGARFRMNREVENGFALEPIFGMGLASIELNDVNSKTATATNISAFSMNTGLLVHITNNINIGVTYGFDNISKHDQNNYDWKYNGKGWLGLGINIAFSNQNNNTGVSGTNR